VPVFHWNCTVDDAKFDPGVGVVSSAGAGTLVVVLAAVVLVLVVAAVAAVYV
jgi:hypothetical protein